jgi:DNA polymerase-3 subunit epsilon
MPRTPLNQRPLAFIDTETTGLDPVRNEVIEVAILREWPDGRTDEWCSKIKPVNIETAHPKALEVNGYTPEAWEDAPTFETLAAELCERLDDCVLVGHNVSFDHAFLQEGLKKVGNTTRLPYHKIDTVTLVFEHLVPKGCTSMSLDRVREFLGWSKDGAHTALVDARDCRRLYKELTGSPEE